jgi:type VI protein secretion system component Hcp
MSREIWVSHCPKAGLQTTQLQGLFSGLTEHEQEMISGGGQGDGRDDCWCVGLVLVKSIDRSSPLIAKALTINE